MNVIFTRLAGVVIVVALCMVGSVAWVQAQGAEAQTAVTDSMLASDPAASWLHGNGNWGRASSQPFDAVESGQRGGSPNCLDFLDRWRNRRSEHPLVPRRRGVSGAGQPGLRRRRSIRQPSVEIRPRPARDWGGQLPSFSPASIATWLSMGSTFTSSPTIPRCMPSTTRPGRRNSSSSTCTTPRRLRSRRIPTVTSAPAGPWLFPVRSSFPSTPPTWVACPAT